MRELWDVYDENGEKTGNVMERGIPAPGTYMLCVHVYLYNSNKEFLIQKRSLTKESHPGEWDITCGAVLHDEESFEGARRETFEEIGIDISKGKITYIDRVKKKKSFADIYFVELDFDIDECVLQKEEVDEIRLVSVDELLSMEKCQAFSDENYWKIVKKALNKI